MLTGPVGPAGRSVTAVAAPEAGIQPRFTDSQAPASVRSGHTTQNPFLASMGRLRTRNPLSQSKVPRTVTLRHTSSGPSGSPGATSVLRATGGAAAPTPTASALWFSSAARWNCQLLRNPKAMMAAMARAVNDNQRRVRSRANTDQL